MSPPIRKLLAAGLPPPPNASFSPILKNEKAKAAAKNFELTIFSADPAQPIDATIAEWKNVLAQEDWAAISIGFGVRGNTELTPLFEKLVNTAIQTKPIPLAFATTPTQIVDAFERVL